MTTTPPLQAIVTEPPTPLHGARFDNYEPYQLRKSARIFSQRTIRTPSPPLSDESPRKSVHRSKKRMPAPRGSHHNLSPPSSNPSSPQPMPRKRTKFNVNDVGMVVDDNKASSTTMASLAETLLTPAKTPQKKDFKADVGPAARVLFPSRPATVEDHMPAARKGAKRQRMTLPGYGDDDLDIISESKLEIWTDSRDRVPELDKSADNPFVGKAAKRSTRSAKNASANSHDSEVQSVLERDEGMIYTFRGRKIYRKFANEEEDVLDDVPLATLNLPEVEDEPRHFTRSSIRPKVLFPSAASHYADAFAGSTSDEEAPTETEDHPVAATPVKAYTHLATPPTTARTTRSRKKSLLDDSPMSPESPAHPAVSTKKRVGSHSPFDAWQRTKSVETGAAGRGRKRGAEAEAGQGDTKKSRIIGF